MSHRQLQLKWIYINLLLLCLSQWPSWLSSLIQFLEQIYLFYLYRAYKMTEQQSASTSASAREDNMTSRTASRELAEQPSTPVLVMNDEKASQPDVIDLEAGNRPEMQEKTRSNEPAAEEDVYTIFTRREITFIAIMASISTFFSPLTANIYFPALNTISTDLGVSNTLVNLTVTTYMVNSSLLASRNHMLTIDRSSKALHHQLLEGSPTRSAEGLCIFSVLCYISLRTSH
jgi:hypothetical protein